MKRVIDNIDSEQNKSRFEFSLLKERLSMLDPLSKARFTWFASFNRTENKWGRCYQHSHFKDEETEAQRH